MKVYRFNIYSNQELVGSGHVRAISYSEAADQCAVLEAHWKQSLGIRNLSLGKAVVAA